MKKTIKTIVLTLFLLLHVFVQAAPLALAQEAPAEETTTGQTQTAETTPPQEEQQTQEQTQSDSQPTTEQVTSTPTPTPYIEDEIDRAARLYREQLQREIEQQVDAKLKSMGITPPPRDVQPSPIETQSLNTADSSGIPHDGVGDVEIETGDATSTGQVVNSGNNNLTGSAVAGADSGSEAQVLNSYNGTGSSNTGSATVDNANTTNQINSATVNTNLNSAAVTGNNTASDNVGDASITTGDANTTGTVLTMVNTNAQGVMVSEFNVADDQVGDLVLDFVANCVLGCGGSTQVANTGNGSNSTNTGSVDTANTTNTTQDNDAIIGNDLVLTADSGNNDASRNTGGDSDITTGDANVAANVLTFANNNIAGNVIYGIVNIFGDLIGDIIFPEEQLQSCCQGSITATNSGNGSNSTNTSDVDIIDNEETFQSNSADITNNITFDATTGDNSTSGNTGGDSTVNTGDVNIDANILNIANSNIIGGNWWIVLVNQAGNWVGKIMGAADGALFAGSEGSDFDVDENGFITVSNNSNGTGSTNDASASTTNNVVTDQTNNAQIENNLSLTANTGNNSADNNTGGNSGIKTGDANIVANLVNFVNNNFSGGGKVFVTVVNVFGSWLGDFVSPGQEKEELIQQEQNQTAQTNSTNTNQNNQNATNNNEDSSDDNKVAGAHATNTQTPQTQTTQSNIGGSSNGSTGGSGVGIALTNAGNDNDSSSQLLVKGAQTSTSTLGSTKNIIKINFAWLLFAGPIVGLIILGKKKLSVRRNSA